MTAASTKDWVGLSAVLAATFMGQVDGFIVTVAAPSLQRDLPASFSQVQLVGAAYVLAAAAGLVTGSRLGDQYGRRRVFLIGVATFTLASLVCGAAPHPEVLVAARFVQGAAAALLIPQELALVRATFLDERQRATAISAYGVVVGLGVIAGLAGGGLVVHWDLAGLGWRTAFLVNVPIGLTILVVGRAAITESRAAAARLDLLGAALAAIALPALLVPLIFGTAPWWGLAALAVLVVQQRFSASPILPLRVLTAPGMPAGLAAILTFFGGNAGLFLVFTYYTQTGLGHDPLAAGLMFVPLGLGFAIGSALSPRFGPTLPVVGCAFLALALLGQLAIVRAPPDAQTILLGVAIGAVGLAEGLVVSPLIASIFTGVDPDDAGAASGIAATVTQFGLASGFAGVGSWYTHVLGEDEHVRAYSAAIGLLVLLALVTCVLCARRNRTFRHTSPQGG